MATGRRGVDKLRQQAGSMNATPMTWRPSSRNNSACLPKEHCSGASARSPHDALRSSDVTLPACRAITAR